MKRTLRHIFFTLCPARPLPQDRASILMYHSISDRTDYFSSVSPEDFARQMAYLARHHIPVISFVELVRRLRAREPLGGAVALTFDDGYRDNYTAAFPILRKYGFPATIFVTTDLIGARDKRDMERCSLDELREMQASGLISMEAHTRTHPRLSKLSRADAEAEIQGSRDVLVPVRGSVPTLFAYPYGDFSDETEALVRDMGFLGAVSVGQGLVHSGSDPMRLPRNGVDRSTSFAEFRGKVSTAIDWYRKLKL